MSYPLVSVLLPVYNEGEYLVEAIESIINQTYQNLELIIIDDASTDNTLEIIKKYAAINCTIKVLKMKKNKGKATCLNWGLKRVQGKYVFEMDGDDWVEPAALAELVRFAERQPEDVVYFYTDRRVYRQNNGELKFRHISKGVPFVNKYKMLSTLKAFGPRFIRTFALKNIGGWPTNYPSNGRLFEDFALVVRLLDEYKFAYLPKVLYNIRQHGENISLVNKKLWWPIGKYIVLKALKRWGDEYIPIFKGKRSNFRLIKKEYY